MKKAKDIITIGMLGWISVVVVAILIAIALNYFGVVSLSNAYLWF
jgi:hypothetical protein